MFKQVQILNPVSGNDFSIALPALLHHGPAQIGQHAARVRCPMLICKFRHKNASVSAVFHKFDCHSCSYAPFLKFTDSLFQIIRKYQVIRIIGRPYIVADIQVNSSPRQIFFIHRYFHLPDSWLMSCQGILHFPDQS